MESQVDEVPRSISVMRRDLVAHMKANVHKFGDKAAIEDMLGFLGWAQSPETLVGISAPLILLKDQKVVPSDITEESIAGYLEGIDIHASPYFSQMLLGMAGNKVPILRRWPGADMIEVEPTEYGGYKSKFGDMFSIFGMSQETLTSAFAFGWAAVGKELSAESESIEAFLRWATSRRTIFMAYTLAMTGKIPVPAHIDESHEAGGFDMLVALSMPMAVIIVQNNHIVATMARMENAPTLDSLLTTAVKNGGFKV